MILSAAILYALPLPAILIGSDEKLVHTNPDARRLMGGTSTGLSYVAALRQPVVLDCVEAAFRLGQSAQSDLVTNIDGRETLWRVSAAPLQSDAAMDAKDISVLVTFEDRTAMREARQIRRDFVANVSHELRSPLTALLGFIETLKGPALGDESVRAKFLDTMEHEANRMNRLVADLLSLSRVEAVERMRPTDAVNVPGLLGTVMSAMRPLAEDKGCDLQLHNSTAEIGLQGDSDQLAQVFTNLVENAIKYGDQSVTIQIDFIDHAPGLRGPAVSIKVINDGEGIDPMHIPRLTERFYRVDSHRSREMGGTGLGLAIVKHIINRHRGRLKIDSVLGKGVTVTVLLPVLTDQS